MKTRTVTLKPSLSLPFPEPSMRIDVPDVPGAYLQWRGPAGPEEFTELHGRGGTQDFALFELFTLRDRRGTEAIFWVADYDGKLYLERLEAAPGPVTESAPRRSWRFSFFSKSMRDC